MRQPPPARPIPPAPRVRDWALAGATAGSFLALAEGLGMQLAGIVFPPTLALLAMAHTIVLVTLLAAATGLALRLAGRRSSYASMVGAMIGPLLLAPALGPLAAAVSQADGFPARAVGIAAAVLLLSVAAARAAASGCHRYERSGKPLDSLFVWGTAALLAASVEHISGQPEIALQWRHLRLPAVGAVLLALALARRLRFGPPRSPGLLFATLLVAVLVLATARDALPWLLLEPRLPAVVQEPPSLLVINLSADARRRPGPLEGEPLWALLASDGVVYRRIPRDAESHLRLPDGTPLARALYERGYAVAAVLTDPLRTAPDGMPEVHTRLGGRGLLLRHGAMAAGGRLLMAYGEPVLIRLGIGRILERPAELTASAVRWLVNWRRERSHVPFFLFVDYGVKGESPDPEGLEDALDGLLSMVSSLSLDEHCLVVMTRPARNADLRGAEIVEAVVRPPFSRSYPERGRRVAHSLSEEAFAGRLLDLLTAAPDPPAPDPSILEFLADDAPAPADDLLNLELR